MARSAAKELAAPASTSIIPGVQHSLIHHSVTVQRTTVHLSPELLVYPIAELTLQHTHAGEG